jgi:hypothetical protein
MPNNLLIVPLLAGYLFVHLCTRFRYRCQALDGYRLLLESAVAGTLLLLVARVLAIAIAQMFPRSSVFFQQFSPTVPYVGTATLSLMLGITVPFIHNRFPGSVIARVLGERFLLPRRMRLARRAFIAMRNAYIQNRRSAIELEIAHGNALTRLLYSACDQGRLISVSLSNRKWYVGYVAESVNLEPRELHFRLLPVLSGYRDKDTLKARQVVDYREVYAKLIDDVNLTDFVVTLALADVQDARLFDERVYKEHFGSKAAMVASGEV